MRWIKNLCGLAITTMATACGGGGGGGNGSTDISAARQVQSNQVPVALIDVLATEFIAGKTITLSSASSTDDDGDNLATKWQLDSPAGSYAKLSSVDISSVEFEPDMADTFTVYLEVSDGRGGLGRTALNITPSLPVADPLPNFVSTAPPDPTLKDRTDAVRLLYQGTFGPRDGDIDALIAQGGDAWFKEQISTEPYFYTVAWASIAAEFDDIDSGENANFRQLSHETFMLNALTKPDQLRQRMTYALSQLFVISDRFDFAGHDQLTMGYVDTLHRNAFGNYRDLLRDVTLHPAMGMYLAMLGNEKADPERNIRPDENFAREVMQLFTVGLQLLNQDGSPILDEATGLPRQTYSPLDVQNYAAAFTGWYFADQESYKFGDTFHSIDWQDRLAPMTAYEEFHQKTAKKLLRNYYVPAGASPSDSLEVTIDSLFYHPNLGPFVARHLIKNFVTSNPSASYVERVAAVFNSNSNSQRGNLASVIQAILFDPEARAEPTEQAQNFGRVKDPLLKFVNFNRLFSVSSYSGTNFFLRNRPSQTFLGAHSVFNFYSPTHTPTKEFADLGLVAPELQVVTPETIVTDASRIAYISTREQRAYWHTSDPSEESTESLNSAIVHDLSPVTDRIETSDLSAAVDFLDEYMTQGQLSEAMKNELYSFYSPRIEQKLAADFYSSEAHRTADIHSLLAGLIYQIYLSPEYSLQR
ncbi:MAG TPA: hypothetical protein DCY55_00220 [Gammaproteobacteria bacterium]|nr:hypothetical protein [Gammaproteobacteria bacterium]